MDRRTFLTTAAAAAASTAGLRAAAPPEAAGELIDTNVTLSDWVVRRSGVERPEQLVAKLRGHGVTTAWVGSFEGVLHSDIAGVNERLARACAREGAGVLQPFGTVNPTFPDWEDDLRRCHEVHRMRGVRLFPNYHGYTLEDARFRRLVELSAQRGLLVQIALGIEDDRSQNPALTAAPVAAAPLPELLGKIRGARVMLLNASSRILGPANPLLKRLAAAGVSFEIATLEGVAGIELLLRAQPDVRLCFGSHTPYFYFASAWLKLTESALTPAQLHAVRSGHARAALASA